jgi:hypothetical protein
MISTPATRFRKAVPVGAGGRPTGGGRALTDRLHLELVAARPGGGERTAGGGPRPVTSLGPAWAATGGAG